MTAKLTQAIHDKKQELESLNNRNNSEHSRLLEQQLNDAAELE